MGSDGQESEIHEIETTLNHRFWSEGEWKAAGTLKAGDLLTLADGTQVEVTEVTYEDRHETVYNMEAADYHTYYVGEDGVWVHNRYGQQGGMAGKGKDKNGSSSTTPKLTSSIHNDSRLVKAVEEMGKNERIQQEANYLINELLSGDTNPGLGTKNLFNDITYLRGRNGARFLQNYKRRI